tara:strand:- start:954 stop:1205 length:252 start_codon:yes stop_codon:yes gene_type:complete
MKVIITLIPILILLGIIYHKKEELKKIKFQKYIEDNKVLLITALIIIILIITYFIYNRNIIRESYDSILKKIELNKKLGKIIK